MPSVPFSFRFALPTGRGELSRALALCLAHVHNLEPSGPILEANGYGYVVRALPVVPWQLFNLEANTCAGPELEPFKGPLTYAHFEEGINGCIRDA